MRILGIDPGTRSLGYGIVEDKGGMQVVDWGVLVLSPRIPIEERLCSIYAKLGDVIIKYKPDEVAIEEPYVGGNVRSAFAIGRAQTVAILAAASRGLPVHYYSPTQVKQQVTGYGRSDKRQVQEVVKMRLNLSQCPQPSDAADALAIAICHLQQSCLNQWLIGRSPA